MFQHAFSVNLVEFSILLMFFLDFMASRCLENTMLTLWLLFSSRCGLTKNFAASSGDVLERFPTSSGTNLVRNSSHSCRRLKSFTETCGFSFLCPVLQGRILSDRHGQVIPFGPRAVRDGGFIRIDPVDRLGNTSPQRSAARGTLVLTQRSKK